VDELVSVITPEPFFAVGPWYEDFTPTADDEVQRLLDRAVHERAGAVPV
jgi:predicted phosphoribosyltransferase